LAQIGAVRCAGTSGHGWRFSQVSRATERVEKNAFGARFGVSSNRYEANMHRRIPLGLDDEASLGDGVAPYSGARVPGAFQIVSAGRNDLSSVQGPAAPSEDPVTSPASFPFKVGDDAYRLRRQDVDWRRSFQEVAVAPDKAAAILELAAQRYQHNATLMTLLRAAAKGLADLHEGGIFILFWLRREQERVAPAAPINPRAVLPPPPIRETPTKTWVEIEMVDAVGKPVPNQKYRIKLPDGAWHEGVLDKKGQARFSDIDPGGCDISFPEIDGREWKEA
jgi:hypothetical protein